MWTCPFCLFLIDFLVGQLFGASHGKVFQGRAGKASSTSPYKDQGGNTFEDSSCWDFARPTREEVSRASRALAGHPSKSVLPEQVVGSAERVASGTKPWRPSALTVVKAGKAAQLLTGEPVLRLGWPERRPKSLRTKVMSRSVRSFKCSGCSQDRWPTPPPTLSGF